MKTVILNYKVDITSKSPAKVAAKLEEVENTARAKVLELNSEQKAQPANENRVLYQYIVSPGTHNQLEIHQI